MDTLNMLIAEAAIQERQREAIAISREHWDATPVHHGLRHSLAATFVRLGLRLDPNADEGLPAFDITPAGRERGC